MSTDNIIIEALSVRFLSLEKGSKPDVDTPKVHLEKLLSRLKNKYRKSLQRFVDDRFWLDKEKNKIVFRHHHTDEKRAQISIQIPMCDLDRLDENELCYSSSPQEINISFPIFTGKEGQYLTYHHQFFPQIIGEPNSIYVTAGSVHDVAKFDKGLENVPKQQLLQSFNNMYNFGKYENRYSAFVRLPIEETVDKIYEFAIQVITSLLNSESWKATKALKRYEEQVQRSEQEEVDQIESKFSVYKISGDTHTKLSSFEDFIETMNNLPTTIAFVYQSPIGIYLSVLRYEKGASPSKKKEKDIVESLGISSMYLEDTLSSYHIVAVTNAIFVVNQSKGTVKNILNKTIRMSSQRGMVDIQENAKQFSSFMKKYVSDEITSLISSQKEKKEKEVKKKAKAKVKEWSVVTADQIRYKAPIIFVFVTDKELRKYISSAEKTRKLYEVFTDQQNNLPKGMSLIQIVIVSKQRNKKPEYTYPQMYQRTLINDKELAVSERKYLPTLSQHDLDVIARTEINKLL